MATPRRKSRPRPKATGNDLRAEILEQFRTLNVPLSEEQFDTAVARAEAEGLSHLDFLRALISDQAAARRQRSIERRVKEAEFPGLGTLEDFDWQFNASSIDRATIEGLATGEFVRRGENLVMVGQSGVGKSRLIEGLGRRLCMHGYRVLYRTSAKLVRELGKCRVDDSLPKRLRYYGRFDLLIIDEFGFEKLERTDTPQASSLLYKVIEARYPGRSTAMVTNIDFEAWSDYLGDPPLAMAFLDRVVDGAIAMKIEGKSYRAHRARRLDPKPPAQQNPAATAQPSTPSTDQKPTAKKKPPTA